MAHNAHKTQKRRRDGRWARQRKQARAGGRPPLPPEVAHQPGGHVASAEAFRYAAEIRNEIHRQTEAEDRQASKFVAKNYDDIPGQWARNPEEMEWQTTCMFSARQTSVARILSDGRKIHTPRSEPPQILNLGISRMLARTPADKRAEKIKSLVSAC